MRRTAALCFLLLAIPALLFASPPEVCRVQGGGTRTIWGVGFVPGQTEVWGWTAAYDEARARSAISGVDYAAGALAGMTPPQGARKYGILDIDPRGMVLAVDFNTYYGGESFFDAKMGPDVVWVKNPDGYSKPWRVREAQPWFVYPEKASPGQLLRIVGRNMQAKLVAVKPAVGGAPVFVTPQPPANVYLTPSMYETSIVLPSSLKPGKYQVYVHNGTCGEAGWGGPIELTIQHAPKPVTNIISVKSFGARGDGIADDTSAVRAAIAKAEKSTPAIVFFPPGRYAISKSLLLRSGVSLKGAGMHNSTICVREDKPLRFDMPADTQPKVNYWLNKRIADTGCAPMLWMWDNTSVSDLGFEDGPGVLQTAYCLHDNCRIERCRIYMPHAPDYSVVVEWGSYGFVMKDCEVESAHGAVFMVHGPHEQVYFGGNKIRCTNPGTENNIFIRSFDRSIIENNVARDADRNFCSQAGHGSTYHSLLQGNSWYNNIPRRHNSGENMYESGNSFWHGSVLKATANTLTVASTPFDRSPFVDTKAKEDAYRTMFDTFVLIIDGRGLGQYRRVISYTPDTLTLDKPWDIIPDSTTYVTIGRAFVETIWSDNTEEHTANWTGWWGNCFGNVIDGQIIRDGEGIYLWAFDGQNSSPVAFNDVIGSEIIGRGQVKFIGPLVFGNTVRSSEIINFRYLPSFHGSMGWANGFDPSNRPGIDFGDSKHSIKGLPATAPLKDWNIIDNNNIYNGPSGIHIAPDANHNILRHNQINVDDKPVADESKTTIVVK